MTFEDLTAYPKIAIDFDNTLIDSSASEYLHAFILAHPEIEFSIVTLRSHSLVRAMKYDLEAYPDAPPLSVFKNIFCFPDSKYDEYLKETRGKADGSLIGPSEEFILSWKGKTCQENGLPVLIDDDIDFHWGGCQKHGVELIDPLDLIL